ATNDPATGLTIVNGLDVPTVYVAAGGSLAWISIRDAGPALTSTLTMPGPVRDVFWDNASNIVHVLGVPPSGAGSTVYVVEPHGDAVFADAPLPFDPPAVVMDVQRD